MMLRVLQKHLGHDQEQLALFALSPNLDATEDDIQDEDASPVDMSKWQDDELSDISDSSEADDLSVHDELSREREADDDFIHPDTVGNLAQDGNEELIPTAVVIENIPLAVKKEQLVQLMTDLRLPLPYAFNYHFDNGVFRGLAFANFTTAEETAAVIDTMNHFELHGRKLRVEYKKMLPLAARERIEREKRERRGQLEEQHRPMPGNP